jgi:hypothetical protein
MQSFFGSNSRMAACAGCLLALATISGCRKAAPAPVRQPSWSSIDLEPGWRVRVVTPIQKSGDYVVKFVRGEEGQGGSADRVREKSDRKLEIAVTASPDLLGYEIAYYSVSAHRRDGAVVAFNSATATIDGVSSPRANAIHPLFQLPGWARSVRILHLLSRSASDHNAAILAARNMRELDRLTALVDADPSACRVYRDAVCEWIPQGIAVRPERRTMEHGAELWLPAR